MKRNVQSRKCYYNIYKVLSFLMALVFLLSCGKITSNYNVLIINGGKKIERASFLDIFENISNVSYREILQPEANNFFSSPEIENYDVLVYYDFVQEINENQKQAFIDLLKRGKGIVFLHHSLVSYQEWDEYEKIIGGRYYQSVNKEDSIKYVQSTYRHDVKIPVQIVNKEHPITKGMDDFIIHDEVYGNYKVLPKVNPIIKTSHPESENIIGWTNTYRKSKIVYIQMGHDHHSFEDENYRRLIKQSINWVISD